MPALDSGPRTKRVQYLTTFNICSGLFRSDGHAVCSIRGVRRWIGFLGRTSRGNDMGRHIRRMGPKSWLALGFLVWLVALGTIRAYTPVGKETGPAVQTSAPLVNPPQA